MGNYSRNTFNPLKNYIGVRLQQGVPLVDADWNELNDVVRQEVYDSLDMAVGSGVAFGNYELSVSPAWGGANFLPNDIYISAGRALVSGRLVKWGSPFGAKYSSQPWTDPARAAKDGVAVLPPLTTPQGSNRTDMVYLDVWEREVGSLEDPNLINQAIGIETCVRLKREVAFRVAEGTGILPAVPPGHWFLPLARLHRHAGDPIIQYEYIEDLRPISQAMPGPRAAAFVPAFLPLNHSDNLSNMADAWVLSLPLVSNDYPPKVVALKLSQKYAHGVLPLLLPDGAQMTYLSLAGYTQCPLECQLVRIRHSVGKDATYYDLLVNQVINVLPNQTERTFYLSFAVDSTDRKHVVDNTMYYYGLFARAAYTPYLTRIHGVRISYQY